jgi:hypothetical protein
MLHGPRGLSLYRAVLFQDRRNFLKCLCGLYIQELRDFCIGWGKWSCRFQSYVRRCCLPWPSSDCWIETITSCDIPCWSMSCSLPYQPIFSKILCICVCCSNGAVSSHDSVICS